MSYPKSTNPYSSQRVSNPDFVAAEILARGAQHDLEEARNAIIVGSDKERAKAAFRKAKTKIDNAMQRLRGR